MFGLTKKYLTALLLAAVTILSCSCAEKNMVNDEEATQTDNKADVVVEIPEETEQEEQEAPVYINPLTGLACETDKSKVRPVTVMVNNIREAIPQIGISEADIVYEIIEEGGITRLLCVYSDYADIPEIGSVRSARDYFIDIADAHDAIFVHAGGSKYAFAELAIRGTNNLDGLFLGQFYRNQERRKTMALEHTLMISGSGIASAIEEKGYRTESEAPSPLVFSEDYKKGEAPASHIEVPFFVSYTTKPYAKAFADYNSETGEYLKGQYGKIHIDGDDGSQLTFKNILTLSCPMNYIQGDSYGRIQVHFTGTGTGTYSVDGTCREIVWSKPSRSGAYTLYEKDGETPLELAPGKSYIAIVNTNTDITLN